MNYRKLGNTGLNVSEIALGGEWLERQDTESVKKIIDECYKNGINLLDCWMAEPNVRTNIGLAIKGHREDWIIQGHIGSAWQNNQYVRTRKMDKVIPAFEDLLSRLQTDYIDLGMIHYVDTEEDYNEIMNGPFIEYVHELKEKGIIRHVGLSTHNAGIAKRALLSGEVEMMLFSINPAFDMMPSTEKAEDYFRGSYDKALDQTSPERVELYNLCEERGVGLTVMKGYAGGRLFKAETSPFGVPLTPVQCLHYCLTRPAVAAVLCGYSTVEHVYDALKYETATEEEKDYTKVLATAPLHTYRGQCTYCGHCKPCPKDIDIAMVNKLYDLATMQEEIPSSIQSHYEVLSAHASDCIHCKGCESRCPFGVKISERMKVTAELFKL